MIREAKNFCYSVHQTKQEMLGISRIMLLQNTYLYERLNDIYKPPAARCHKSMYSNMRSDQIRAHE